MSRASLLGMCLNSFHKADVWVLRSGLAHILFSTSSIYILIIVYYLEIGCCIHFFKFTF